MKFLSPLLMIVTALDHQVISRLKQTWELISPSSLEIFQNLQTLCSASVNYNQLRQVANSSGSTLPLAIISKDVMMALEIIPPHQKDQIQYIPYDKFRHLGMILHRSHLPSLSLGTSSPTD